MGTVQHLCVSGVIKGIMKYRELKISLSNSRGGKILKFTTSGREPMGVGRRGERVMF